MTLYQSPSFLPRPIPERLSVELVRLRRMLPRDLDPATTATLDRLVEEAYLEGHTAGVTRGRIDMERDALCGPRTVTEGVMVHVMVGDSTECIAEGVLTMPDEPLGARVVLPEGALVRTTAGSDG